VRQALTSLLPTPPPPSPPPRALPPAPPQPFVIPSHLRNLEESDDTMLLVAGLLGFFLCMLCAALLPSWGVESELVMGGGMATLLLFIVWVNFCPSCTRKSGSGVSPSPMESVTPTAVFLVTGCIGAMLGGMFGGVLKNVQWDKM
jgi:hypothetical protein